MSPRFYVYELVDPRSGKAFYVGKGAGKRIDAHEVEARSGRVSRKCDTIREIEACGLSVEKRKIKSFEDEQLAYDYEMDLISHHGLGTLTNVMPGGGTARGIPTLSRDRSDITSIAEFMRRTRDGQITTINVLGHKIDLSDVISEFRSMASTIVERRGLDCANAMVANKRAVFGYGDART